MTHGHDRGAVKTAEVGRPRKLPWQMAADFHGLQVSYLHYYPFFQNHGTNPNPNLNPYEVPPNNIAEGKWIEMN